MRYGNGGGIGERAMFARRSIMNVEVEMNDRSFSNNESLSIEIIWLLGSFLHERGEGILWSKTSGRRFHRQENKKIERSLVGYFFNPIYGTTVCETCVRMCVVHLSSAWLSVGGFGS